MSEPIIHVIPPEYYGGAAPKRVRRPEEMPAPLLGATAKVARPPRISPKALFIIVVAVLFAAVVGGAIWYFTRGARAPAPAPVAPAVQPSAPAPVAPPSQTPQAPASPPAPPVPETPAPAEAPAVLPSSDGDNDGLTQAEEELYHTDPTLPDTDHDGFLDGHEVFNLYNPSGVAPEKLEAAGLAKRFHHAVYPYEALYPAVWTVLPDATAREVSFQSATAESISVTVIDNPGNATSIAQWAESSGLGTFTDWTTNKQGFPAKYHAGEKELRGVFGEGGYLYVLRYGFPENGAPAYKRTFEMMMNSFVIRE